MIVSDFFALCNFISLILAAVFSKGYPARDSRLSYLSVSD